MAITNTESARCGQGGMTPGMGLWIDHLVLFGTSLSLGFDSLQTPLKESRMRYALSRS